jgi:hypothetical protein
VDTEAFGYIAELDEGGPKNYAALAAELLTDGTWRTAGEIATGIGAGEKNVRTALEANPDKFEMRTGEQAKALGRAPQARLWQLSTLGSPPPTETTET